MLPDCLVKQRKSLQNGRFAGSIGSGQERQRSKWELEKRKTLEVPKVDAGNHPNTSLNIWLVAPKRCLTRLVSFVPYVIDATKSSSARSF